MDSAEIHMIKVQKENTAKLLEISRQTFFDSFGPPHNTLENINAYINEAFTIEKIKKEILNPSSEFYFAEYQNEVIGYIKLNSKKAQTEIVTGTSLEIERIYVLKSYQGNGIGQFLLNTILQKAKEKKVEFIWLGVWDQNIRAIKFYERNNFKIFDTHPFMLGSEHQTDLMMKLVIELV